MKSWTSFGYKKMSSKRYNRGGESRCIDIAVIGMFEKITAYVNHENPLLYVVIKLKCGIAELGIPKSSWCNISVRTPDDFKLEEFIPAIREGKIIVSILKNSLKENLSSPHGKMYAMKAIDSFLNPRISNAADEEEGDSDEEENPTPKKLRK